MGSVKSISQISQHKLNKILEQHKLWLESGGVEGVLANLQGAYLWCADLKGVDLRGVKLVINIRDCLNFEGAKFTSDTLPWLILHPK